MADITYKDLIHLLDEMEVGAKNKSRTINDITDKTVKYIVQQESSMAIKAGVSASILATGAGVSGAVVGSIGGAGGGIVSGAISSAAVGGLGLAGGAAAGGAAGSAVPVIGTIIGAVVGAGIGVFAGSRIEKHKKSQYEALHQEVLKKQNRIIKELEGEVEELKKKFGKALDQNERYKYIIGLLMANEELKTSTV